MVDANEYYVIMGKDASGKKLRPSDWIERLCSTFASYDEDHRLRYSSMLIPGTVAGERCILLSPELVNANPAACRYIMEFVSGNQLQMTKPDSLLYTPLALCA